jgi:hypothetical protein
VAFLRLTRDRRGYENTFLLHAAYPGARPTVLYWYRSAPGVRVGRPALDEDAIRTIEEQHPDIDFDWPHILEVGAIIEPEVERRPVRPQQKRRPVASVKPFVPATAQAPATADQVDQEDSTVPPDDGTPGSDEAAPDDALASTGALETALAEADGDVGPDELIDEIEPPAARAHDLLDELVGHEIATRLHARYSEIISRVHRIPEEHPQRSAWEARAEALNPDNWVTPDEVLGGVSHADALFDALRNELIAH